MAFDLRCPGCRAKLRFDEPPPKGEIIECGKCEKSFPSPTRGAYTETKDSAKASTAKNVATGKKPTKPDAAEPPKPKAFVQKEREHFNPLILLLIVGGLMLVLILGLFLPWIFFIANAAQTQSIVASIPENYNAIRGVNVKAMRNVPKVRSEQEKYFDINAYNVFADVNGKLGIKNEGLLTYYVVAREANTATPVLHYYLYKKGFDRSQLGNGEPVEVQLGGKQAVALCITDRLVVVAHNEKNAGNFSSTARSIVTKVGNNYVKPGSDNTMTATGSAGLLCTRGQVWAIYREVGSLKGYLGSHAELIKEDNPMAEIRKAMGQTKVFATWTSFGSAGVRFGAAIEIGSEDDAKALVKSLKAGELGKADDSFIPNQTRGLLPYIDPKQNGAFMQYLEYKSSKSCAYITTTIENVDKARQTMEGFNNATRAIGGGQQGPGGPPGFAGPPGGMGGRP
jgi:hypothetical protein